MHRLTEHAHQDPSNVGQSRHQPKPPPRLVVLERKVGDGFPVALRRAERRLGHREGDAAEEIAEDAVDRAWVPPSREVRQPSQGVGVVQVDMTYLKPMYRKRCTFKELKDKRFQHAGSTCCVNLMCQPAPPPYQGEHHEPEVKHKHDKQLTLIRRDGIVHPGRAEAAHHHRVRAIKPRLPAACRRRNAPPLVPRKRALRLRGHRPCVVVGGARPVVQTTSTLSAGNNHNLPPNFAANAPSALSLLGPASRLTPARSPSYSPRLARARRAEKPNYSKLFACGRLPP